MIILIIAYLIIAAAVYYFKVKDWTGSSTFEKIWYSLFWIVMIPLYGIYRLHNR